MSRRPKPKKAAPKKAKAARTWKWPTQLGAFGGTELVQQLISEGIHTGAAYQACSVGQNDEGAARQYLEVYQPPHGTDRGSRGINTYDHAGPWNDSIFEHVDARYCTKDGPYNYDALVDPSQLVDLNGTTIADVARAAIAASGASNLTEQICALYDFTKEHVSYQYNTMQWGCGDYSLLLCCCYSCLICMCRWVTSLHPAHTLPTSNRI